MKEQILIVDDEMPIRRLLEKMFSNEYAVSTAADAFEAMEIIKTNNVSLIVSDQRMPGMTGVELFGKVRLSHPHITRILLSGYIEKNDLEKAFEDELIHFFISKPWSVKELKALVADALEDQKNGKIEQNMQTV